MSVRTIPKNYRNLTGLAASTKAEKPFFESTLERDFLTLLEFDRSVYTYDVQPIEVSWTDDNERHRGYTPDVLVHYYPPQQNILYEVKYRSDLRANWKELKPKFKAAISHAKSNGWRFKLITEVEIRTSYMENARFLLPYLRVETNEEHSDMLLRQLVQMRQCSIEALIKAIFNDRWAQAELVPTLWYLIASGRVCTDLNIPLTMSSNIWLRK
ncbi:heteromeric transposase endonuclease subunit TnsA [Vibrio anguillarum]|uniref:TnsA endonuclease N-terminal domain-containing protein n=1 Tax=Vibrio anguillarum TaxID=55601 RepID=UPI00188A4F6A|nr:TnsA endonuclease N-terminal domain-containing protein [Vibrio anguillarum]MBF4332969.1 heteromeric transposase endonuclease subunit TnsA [Vibrio anguillarum]